MHRLLTDLLMVERPTEGDGSLDENKAAMEGFNSRVPFKAPCGMDTNRREKLKGYTYREREMVDYDG